MEFGRHASMVKLRAKQRTACDHRVFITVEQPANEDMDGQEQRQRSERLQRLGLEEGDYYFSPEGYLVFTEQYHIKRGYCCQSGCRHCPFGFHEKSGKGKVG